MKKLWNKAAAAVLAASLAVGMTACGQEEIQVDPEKYPETAVATVGDEKIYLDEANYILRGQQYSMESLYTMMGYTNETLWSQYADQEQTVTMEEYLKQMVLTELIQTYVLNQEAEELGITLSEEDEEKIQARIEDDQTLEEEFLEASGFTEELARKVYTNNALALRVYEKLVEDVDTNVDEEEFRHVKVEYLYLKDEADESASSTASETESETEEVETETEESAEASAEAETTEAAETESESQETEESTENPNADGSLTEADAEVVLAKLEDLQDVNEVYEELEEQFDGRLSKIESNSVGKTETEDNELFAEIYEMKNGEFKKVHIENKGWYIIHCLDDNDPEGKQADIDQEIENRKGELFTEKYEEILADGPEVKVEYAVWNGMKLAGEVVFVAPTTESSTEGETGTAESGAEETESGAEESSSETESAAETESAQE